MSVQTPRVVFVAREDIVAMRTWLREHAPQERHRAWIDCEHAVERVYPGGLAAFLNRSRP